MSDNIQQRIKEMDEQITLRLKDEGFELAETNENKLFQEDLAGDDEIAFAKGIEPMIDEDDKEYPGIRVLDHDRTHNTHGPAFQRHDLEQRIQRFADTTEPLRKIFTEQLGRDNGKHVVDQQQHQRDRTQAGNRPQ